MNSQSILYSIQLFYYLNTALAWILGKIYISPSRCFLQINEVDEFKAS